MEIDYEELAQAAILLTDQQFRQKFNALQLTEADIQDVILNTGISREELTQLLREVTSATATNESTNAALRGIAKAARAVLAIATKII